MINLEIVIATTITTLATAKQPLQVPLQQPSNHFHSCNLEITTLHHIYTSNLATTSSYNLPTNMTVNMINLATRIAIIIPTLARA